MRTLSSARYPLPGMSPSSVRCRPAVAPSTDSEPCIAPAITHPASIVMRTFLLLELLQRYRSILAVHHGWSKDGAKKAPSVSCTKECKESAGNARTSGLTSPPRLTHAGREWVERALEALLLCSRKEHPKLGTCSCEARHHCPGGTVQKSGYLPVGQLFELA
jgi:hypothetical protein